MAGGGPHLAFLQIVLYQGFAFILDSLSAFYLSNCPNGLYIRNLTSVKSWLLWADEPAGLTVSEGQ